MIGQGEWTFQTEWPFTGKDDCSEKVEYNLYCDESCHLEKDQKKAMSLVSIIVPKQYARKINKEIVAIKKEHGISSSVEVKWTKASPCNVELYLDLIDYFFRVDNLNLRALVVPDKTKLNHAKYNQSHDDWYYKMYYTMLKHIFNSSDVFYVYIDVKDTNSGIRANKLEDVCANSKFDFNHNIVRRVQPIRSDEVQIMQLVDIFAGALTYRNNNELITASMSTAKVRLVERIIKLSGSMLDKSTPYGDKKFNLFIWDPDRRGF